MWVRVGNIMAFGAVLACRPPMDSIRFFWRGWHRGLRSSLDARSLGRVMGCANMASEAEKLLIEKLFEINAIKFGKFTLKSGIESPVYIDLRVIVSYPDVMNKVSEMLWSLASESKAEFSLVCGVPYTALPIASCMSVSHNVPMVVRRKEAKSYGTKKLIEGVFQAGSKCLVVEDVVTSGSSVFETVEVLSTVDIQVSDAVVLLDRCQGGEGMLKSRGVHLHSLLTLTKVIQILQESGKVDSCVVEQVNQFLAANQFRAESKPAASLPESAVTFEERATIATHPVTKRLFEIMHQKCTNLAVSADLTRCDDVLKLVNLVGPHVCLVKTHVDVLEDFSPGFVKSLQELAAKHNCLIFEDRKFADIGNTVKLQYSRGIYRISEWADLVNAHAVPGDGVIGGLKEIGLPLNRACLLIGEMSAAGTLATGGYTEATLAMAKRHADFVVGFISLSRLVNDPKLIHMTPGVKLVVGGDSLGQQYLTPAEVISKRGSDIIIVGRGIYQADDPVKAAVAYKEAGFKAYLERTTHKT